MADPRDAFRGKSFILLTSFKKDGSPVTTQMWFALDNGRLFVRSDSRSMKVKRLARNPVVRVAPSGVKKVPVSEEFTARAVRVGEADARRVAKVYSRKYLVGYNWEAFVLRPFYNTMAKLNLHQGRGEPIFYEIIPEETSTQEQASTGQAQASAPEGAGTSSQAETPRN